MLIRQARFWVFAYVALYTLFTVSACSNSNKMCPVGPPGPPGPPPPPPPQIGIPIPGGIDRKVIQNNVIQARLSPKGFAFIESDLMNVVTAALCHPLTINIPRYDLGSIDSALSGIVLCDNNDDQGHPVGCNATINIIPGSLHIARAAPNGQNQSLLTVNARVEIIAQNIFHEKANNTPTDDCQVDVAFKNHYSDVCQSGVSLTNDVYCQDFCNAQTHIADGTTPGHPVSFSLAIGVDPVFGYPQISMQAIDLALSGAPECFSSDDVLVYQPHHPPPLYSQTQLNGAPLFCGAVQVLYGAITQALTPLLKSAALHAVNSEIATITASHCATNSDCDAGLQCSNVKLADGYLCMSSGQCVLPEVDGMACNDGTHAIPQLIGLERQQDLGQLASSFLTDTSGPLQFIAGIGGYLSNDSDADLQNRGVPVSDDERGLSIGGFLGVNTQPAPCVQPQPQPQISTINPLVFPDSIDLFDPTAKNITTQDYHAAVSLHQNAFSQLSWGLYENGGLCITFAGTPQLQLNSKLLSYLTASLNHLTDGENHPAFLYVYPTQLPSFGIGKGSLTFDSAGQPILDTPNVDLSLKQFNVEFYSLISDRYVRLFTLQVDFDVGVFLEFNPDGSLLPVTSDFKKGLGQVQVLNLHILAEHPQDLQNVIPALLDFALPFIANSVLHSFQLPTHNLLPGYNFNILGVRGMNLIAGSQPERYEFLSAFGRVDKTSASREIAAPAQPQVAVSYVDTSAEQTTITLQFSNAAQEPLEYAYRLDGGLFAPFSAHTTVTLSRPLLQIGGEHVVEVVARRLGDYRTQNTTPVQQTFVLPDRTLQPTAAAKELPIDVSASVEKNASGCHQVGNDLSWLCVLALSLVLAVRRSRYVD